MMLKTVLLLCSTVSLSRAFTEGHFEPPIEEDVEIIVPCIVDYNVFGGIATETSFTVSYYEEIEYIPGDDDIETIVRELDLATVNKLLKAAQINCVLPPSTRLLQVSKTAVGLSANPEDQPLELECLQLETTDGNECVVVDAGFEVIYTGQGTEDDGFEESFLTAVQGVIDSGELNSSNDQIVSITVTDSGSYARDSDDDNNIRDPDAVVTFGDESSTPIIIAALVGTVLLGGAGLAYRRSKQSNTSDEPSTPPHEEKVEEET